MSNFSQKEKKKMLVLLYHRYCWDLKSIFFDIIFINIMYQLIPKAPTPRHTPGIYPKYVPHDGAFDYRLNTGRRSPAKGFRAQIFIHWQQEPLRSFHFKIPRRFSVVY